MFHIFQSKIYLIIEEQANDKFEFKRFTIHFHSIINNFFNFFSLRIFGHQIDENNPSQISEVAEGDENGGETNGKVSFT